MSSKSWVVLIVGAIIAVSAFAGDGIPMGNAVFYPSVEAVYTNTDNLFLADPSMPNGNVSDSFWLIRPALGFEFPFKQSYVRLDLAYQYKDYDHFQLSDHNTYDGHLVGNFKFGNGATLRLDEQFVQGVQETLKFDPGYEQYFGNTPFHQNDFKIGVEMPMGQRDSLELYALSTIVRFDNSTDVTDQRPFYDYDQVGGGVTWRHHYSELSNWLADVLYMNNTPQHQPADIVLMTDPNKKYDAWRGMVGWEGAASKRFGGYAKVGYESMRFPDNAYSEFSGLVVDAGLGYTPSEFLKVNLSLFRNPYQSTYNVNNYYTSTGGDLQVHQEVSRYFFWTAGYRYQENAYPDAVVADVYGYGLVTSPEFFLTQGEVRKDKIGRAFGEVGFHLNKQFSVRANYQYEDRNSNIHYFDAGVDKKPYTYTENRVMIQAQLGW